MTRLLFALALFVLPASPAFAAGGIINWYDLILTTLGFGGTEYYEFQFILAGLVSLSLLLVIGFKFRSYVNGLGSDITPRPGVSLGNMVEAALDVVYGLVKDVIGEKAGRPFLPVLSAVFLFILISNLTGLVPGFPPATENFSSNLAVGFSVFLLYNYAGWKEHRASYVKQFFGPVVFLAPLILIIELISHVVRPFALSLRLYGNIFGDHLVLGVLTELTYVVVPAFFLFFGLLVASLQSFVFTLLSSIYIALAISHDH